MCCHHHRRRNHVGPVRLLFSALRAQTQPQSIQHGEKLPIYASNRALGTPLNAQTTGTIPIAPSEKAASRWESPDDVLPPPPEYDSQDYEPRQAHHSATTTVRDPKAMAPEERVAFGREYVTEFLSAHPPEVGSRSGGSAEPMNRWAAKLQRKEEKYIRKVERKAEKYARKAAKHAERY